MALIFSVLLLYLTGILWDHHMSRTPLFLCAVVFVVAFAAIPLLSGEGAIGTVLLVINVAQSILRVGFDADLGRDVVQSGNVLESSVLIEIARIWGGIIALILAILVFLVAGSIPGYTFTLLAILFLPFALYALGWRRRT